MINDKTAAIEEQEPDLAITLPLSAWRLVYRHLVAGIYAEVQPVVDEIDRQVGEQAAALAQRAETTQAEAESKAATLN